MITEIFSIEAETQKILCVLRGIENEWVNNEKLAVEFRYYQDVTPRGEQIDSYMNDLLFGNQFRHFAHLTAIMKAGHISFWLTIAEDDENSSLEASFNVCFDDLEEDGPHFSGEVDFRNVRNLLWKIFDFFDNGYQLKPDAKELFKNLVTK